VRLSSEHVAAEEFLKHPFINTSLAARCFEWKPPSRFNGFDNGPKLLKRLNINVARNTGLKSGVTDSEQLHGYGSRVEV
jgi:hypothetical protein